MKSKEIGLKALEQIISESAGSSGYTNMLLKKGPTHIGRKVVEESVEALLASESKKRNDIVAEISDLFYHVMVLLYYHNISINDISKHLALNHQKLTIKEDSDLWDKYLEAERPFYLKDILKVCGKSVPKGADIVLFSHNFNKNTLSSIQQAARFSEGAKILKDQLAGNECKTKMVVPKDMSESYRRSTDLVLPVICILNVIVLPICLNIIAAYIKDYLDHRQISKEVKITIRLVTKEGGRTKEKWFKIEGYPNDVIDTLKKLRGRK